MAFVYMRVLCLPMSSYTMSTDPLLLPVETVNQAIQRRYACAAPLQAFFLQAVANSLEFACCSPEGDLAAYARVISDPGSFAAVTDAFVLEAHRGKGLAELLIDAISAHPDLATLPLQAPAHPILEIGTASV